MTRVYGPNFVCDCCRRPGPFGWVYRCTQDREDMIEQAASHGIQIAFDELGKIMTGKLCQRTRSPAARADRLSFLSEISPGQMTTYRPEHIATILRQREKVHKTICQHQYCTGSNLVSHLLQVDKDWAFDLGCEDNDPWVPNVEQECRYMVCPLCRPGAAERSFQSLDGVAKGEILPTSAVGYGFHAMGERPVVDAEVVKNIGCLPVPLPQRARRATAPSSHSGISLMELLESQIAQGQRLFKQEMMKQRHSLDGRMGPSKARTKAIQGELIPENNAGARQHAELETNANGESLTGLPWTPPPSPRLRAHGTVPETKSNESASKWSILESQSSLPLEATICPKTPRLRSIRSPLPEQAPFLPESACDAGLTLPFNEYTFKAAYEDPLNTATMTNGIAKAEEAAPRSETAKEHDFGKAPVQVEHGVAVLEESVELGVPDVIMSG